MENRQILQFYFVAKIKTVSLSLRFPCEISIIWKRKQQTRQIQQPRKIENGICKFQDKNKLELQCNMVYDDKKQHFQQKKTKFVIIIYSSKGKKQAGELQFDLAQLLNSKKSNCFYLKKLSSCPDKNAFLQFQLCAMLHGQANFKKIHSQNHSQNPKLTQSQSLSDNLCYQKLDFKKKKIGYMEVISESEPVQRVARNIPFSLISEQNMNLGASSRSSFKISKTKQNTFKMYFLKIYQQNSKLKEDLQQFQAVEAQNKKLKQQISSKQNSYLTYYQIKMKQIEIQLQQLRGQHQKLVQLQILKSDKQLQIQQIKQKIGRIINFSIQAGHPSIADELFSVPQLMGNQNQCKS